MKALILGCSHAAGAEMEKDPAITCSNPREFGWRNSYPVLVAQQLGYQPLNYAISGGSNDAMFRIFSEQIAQLTLHDIVIACWTGIDRSEVWHEIDQQWLPLSHGQHVFYKTIANDHALSGLNVGGKISLHAVYEDYLAHWSRFNTNLQANTLNKIKNILALNTLAQQHEIRVINVDSFYPVECPGIKWATDRCFLEWAGQTNQPRTEWGHYFLATHQAFADLILSNI